MIDLDRVESLKRYWNSTLFHNKFLMSLSTQVLVGETVKCLEELEAMKEKEIKEKEKKDEVQSSGSRS